MVRPAVRLLLAPTLLVALLVACTSAPPAAPSSLDATTTPPTANPTVTPTSTPRFALPASTSTATPTAVPFPVMTRDEANARRTGDPAIDRVIAALLGGVQADVDELVELTRIACVEVVNELVEPPQCEEDEPDGTVVEVFQAGSCEGYWKREPPYVGVLDPTQSTLAMVIPIERRRASATLVAFEPHNDGFSRNANAFYVHIVDGRIVFNGLGCNTVEDLIERAVGEPLISPVSFPDLVPPIID